ncbi:hypothetical protein BGZ76_003436, partial [Entomortierella beljakovae]
MSRQWKKSQADGTVQSFWRKLPKQSSAHKLKTVQSEQLITNVKRLYKRDNIISGTLDDGLVGEAKQFIVASASSSSQDSLHQTRRLATCHSEEDEELSGTEAAVWESDDQPDDQQLHGQGNDEVTLMHQKDNRDEHKLEDTSPAGAASGNTKKSKRAKPFTAKGRRSFGERFEMLGEKWVLQSGTVVEDVIYRSGIDSCKTYCSPHSFMLDLNDPQTAKLFSEDDWDEIVSDLPSQAVYSEEAYSYMDKFSNIDSIVDLEKALNDRPTDPDSLIIYGCLDQWLDLFKTADPSPFSIINSLGEAWWLQNAWGATRKLAKGVPYVFILPGEKACIDSMERRNGNITAADVKQVGPKADLIWRSMIAPEHDWGAAEAATNWDPSSLKYRYESTHKLPRELHDILVGRTHELGMAESLRSEYVSGLIFGGPVIQRFLLCWGTKGNNITRLVKMDERRICSSISSLSESLWGAHELLLFK